MENGIILGKSAPNNVRGQSRGRGCACRSCLYHRLPLCSGLLSLTCLTTIILSPMWILPHLHLQEGLHRLLGYVRQQQQHQQQQQPGVLSLLLLAAVAAAAAVAAVAVLGYNRIHAPSSMQSASPSSSRGGDPDTFTGSRKADLRLAWGLVGAVSLLALGLLLCQLILVSGSPPPSSPSPPAGRRVDDDDSSLGHAVPGLLGSYVLYQLLRRNQFSLHNVAAEIVGTLRTMEKRSRQPVNSLFMPGSHSH